MSDKQRTIICSPMLRRDFRSVFRSVMLSAPPGCPVSELYRRAICHPAREFYVPVRAAMREMRIIDISGRDGYYNPQPLRRQMFLDIHAAMTRLQSTDASLSRRAVLEAVLCSQAPRFYISQRTARYFINSRPLGDNS